MNRTPDRMLRQRLRAETDRIETGPPPVDAILRRGRAIRTRRRGAVASCVAVVAVTVAVTASVQAFGTPGKPAFVALPGHPPGHAVTLNVPDPRAPGGVFASGTADGRPWRLAVRNIAGPAPWCLPAVMLNGHNGDVLYYRPGADSIIGNVAFLADADGDPGTGNAFVELGSRVTGVTVALSDGARFAVRPVAVSLCGQRFHLAGFGYLAVSVRTVTAYVGDRITLVYRPTAAGSGPGYGPRSLRVLTGAGIWDNTKIGQGSSASGRIGSGREGSTTWRISMTLGSEGQCYTGSASPRQAHGRAEECLPIEAPPAGATLVWVPFPASASSGLSGYAGLVSPRTAYVIVRRSDGTTRKLVPADIGGRKYFGLAVGHGNRLVSLTLYDAAGHAFASTTSIPPPQ